MVKELTEKDVKLPKRFPDSNKGTYGRVLFIGASNGCAGAGVLACEAAYRAGCGLVKALVGGDSVTALNVRLPEAMTGVLFDELGRLDRDVLEQGLKWATCVVVGPGLKVNEESERVVRRVIESELPKVIDADALTILSEIANNECPYGEKNRMSYYSTIITGEAVFTPHVKELSRLLSIDTEEIKKSFEATAKTIRKGIGEAKKTVIMKDARTLVVSDSGIVRNTTGNNGMSTGGSGDVLAGLTGGLIAAGLKPSEAAVSAVYLHGLAGDYAAKELGEASMLASDIIRHISEAFRTVQA